MAKLILYYRFIRHLSCNSMQTSPPKMHGWDYKDPTLLMKKLYATLEADNRIIDRFEIID